MSRGAIKQFLIFYLIAVGIVAAIIAAGVIFPVPDVVAGLIHYAANESSPINLVTVGRYAIEKQPAAWLILLFAAAPTLAAIAVSLGSGGWRGLAGLLARLKPAGPGRRTGEVAGPYLLLLGVSAVVLVGYLWWGSRVGAAGVVELSRRTLGDGPLQIGLTLAIGHLIDEGGALEELGWRGFGLPRLVEAMGSPLRASLVLGALWWAWHLPREVPALISGNLSAGMVSGQALFLLTCLALSVLTAWGWTATGGSALPGVLIHGGTNVWSKSLGSTVNPWAGTDVRTVIVILLALPAAWWLAKRGRATPALTP